MAEPSSASEVVQAAAGDVDNHASDLSASVSSPGGGKRSATEAFEKDSVEDLKDSETTLDDVLVSPLAKKSKLLDEELPDVDDNEEFPQQEEDLDAELALGLENGEKEQDEGLDMGNGDLNLDQDDLELNPEDLNMEQEQKQEEEEDSEPPTSQNNEIDIVDVDSDEEEEVQEFQGYHDEEEDDDDVQETARAITRAQNQREARMLLQQLDDSARSKLCLTALEKYGEELFYGHEDARDAILVDACAQDSVLSLMRDAIRVRDLYMRGSSAAAPVELDDDSDSDADTGGYEDDTEGGEEEKTGDSNDDEVVVISEEESDNEAPKESEDIEEKQQSASDENDGDDAEDKEEEDAALGDVGENVASGSPVAT